jgi:hypothetical protein
MTFLCKKDFRVLALLLCIRKAMNNSEVIPAELSLGVATGWNSHIWLLIERIGNEYSIQNRLRLQKHPISHAWIHLISSSVIFHFDDVYTRQRTT